MINQTDIMVDLDGDIVFDDLVEHEAECRNSYLMNPADVIEANLRELDIEPRKADRKLIEDGYVPHRFQEIVHNELMAFRFYVLVCHRRFGKTVLAVNALCDAAVRHGGFLGKPGRFAYICPQRNQAKAVAWMYLKAFAARVPGSRKNESELFIEFPNGSRVTLYGADSGGDSLRGFYLDGCVFDEPSQMKPEVWQEVVRPALGDHSGWCLFIGTPKGVNLFSELFDGAQNDKLGEWGYGSYPISETIEHLEAHDGTPILTDDEVASIEAGLSPEQFRQEFMCDFTASSSDVIITLDEINQAVKRSNKSTKYLQGMEKVVGIDPAWMGSDKTVVAFRWGLEMFPLKEFGKDEHDQIIGYLSHIRKEYEPDAWYCDQAYAEGIYALCDTIGIELTLIAFGGDPIDKTQYANRVTEMYFKHKAWLRAGGKLPNDSVLKGDLSSVTYEFVKVGKFDVRQRHKKSEIKKKINRSPDRGDAAVLTTCEKVIPKPKNELENHLSHQQVSVSDGNYHPHNKLRRKNKPKPKTARRR